MPRRGRSMTPAVRPSPPAYAPPPPPPPAPAMAAPQQPSLFKQIAATAAGVAVGSAVGHTVGHALTGSFGGSGGSEAAAAAPAQVAPEPQPIYNQPAGASQLNPCEFEIKQFMDCAQKQGDITLCQGFNEAIKLCKQQNGVSL